MCGNGALVASSFLHLVLETLSCISNFNKTVDFTILLQPVWIFNCVFQLNSKEYVENGIDLGCSGRHQYK